MNEDLKELNESKNYDEIYNIIETKFSQFESRWNSVLASEEGVKLYRNTKLSPNNRDKIYRKMFAELIVRECIECTKEWRDAVRAESTRDYSRGYVHGCDDAIVEMKTRFGVEE